jgi:hypothetical protein
MLSLMPDHLGYICGYLTLKDISRWSGINKIFHTDLKNIAEKRMDQLPWEIIVKYHYEAFRSTVYDLKVRIGWLTRKENLTNMFRDVYGIKQSDQLKIEISVKNGIGGSVVYNTIRYGYGSHITLEEDFNSTALVPITSKSCNKRKKPESNYHPEKIIQASYKKQKLNYSNPIISNNYETMYLGDNTTVIYHKQVRDEDLNFF